MDCTLVAYVLSKYYYCMYTRLVKQCSMRDSILTMYVAHLDSFSLFVCVLPIKLCRHKTCIFMVFLISTFEQQLLNLYLQLSLCKCCVLCCAMPTTLMCSSNIVDCFCLNWCAMNKETNGIHALNRFHTFKTHEESVTWLKS